MYPTLTPALQGEALILPATLILFAALLGGLRALLVSPLRSGLMSRLPGERRHKVEQLAETSPHLIATTGLVRLGCVVTAATLLIQQTEMLAPLDRWPVWAGAGLFAGIVLESVPSLVVRSRAIRPVLWMLPVIQLLALPLRPITAMIQAGLRMLGADPDRAAADGLAADRGEELDDAERRMIAHVMELPDTDAAEVMTPRTDLSAVPAHTTVAHALQVARADGHSRILVHQEDLDHIEGFFYIKDVLEMVEEPKRIAEMKVSDMLRTPYFVPETMRVPALLEEFRRRRVHIAVVVDEYGGTAGVVTVEDLLEEIVGDIEDEHDPLGEAPLFERVDEFEMLVDGRVGISDINEEFPCELPDDEDFDTVAGL